MNQSFSRSWWVPDSRQYSCSLRTCALRLMLTRVSRKRLTFLLHPVIVHGLPTLSDSQFLSIFPFQIWFEASAAGVARDLYPL